MSCGIVTCPDGRRHHHHARNGVLLPAACVCTRPTTWLQTISIERLIDFAATHPGKVSGAIAEAVRRDLGITEVRYLQMLSRAIHTEEALAHDPLTTHRLLREADQRARSRAARTAGH